MIKKLLIALPTVVLSTSLQAQTTLTGLDMKLTTGESFSQATTAYMPEGPSGANQTWDFSTSTGTAAITTIVAPSSLSNSSNYPTANLAMTNGTGAASFGMQNNSVFQLVGVTSSSVNFVYTNPEETMRYPFTYNNSYTDTWETSFVSGGLTFYRKGSTTLTADAYGTIILPSGTYTDVLRVKMLQVYTDSTDLGGSPYIINYSNDQYVWYKNGVHASLFSTYTFTTGASVSNSSTYLTIVPLGLKEQSLIATNLTVYPNPSNSVLNIQIDKGLIKQTSLSTMEGVIIDAENIINNNTTKIDVSGLPKGIYIVNIKTNEDLVIHKKVTVE